MRSRMMKMGWPAMGLAPEGNSVVIATRIAERALEGGAGVLAPGVGPVRRHRPRAQGWRQARRAGPVQVWLGCWRQWR
jgi:hypothetical protein